MSSKFPVSSAKAFNSLFGTALAAQGPAFVAAAFAPTPVTVSGASAATSNTTARTYIMTSGSAQTLTIAPDMTAVGIGEEIKVIVNGAGLTTIAAGSGVTIRKLAATLKSNGQYSVIRLIKTAVNTWVATGDLAAS